MRPARTYMHLSSSKRQSMILVSVASAAFGLNGFASATQATVQATDEQLRARVQAALLSDPYFYDEHVTVSVQNGDVHLRGFVSSDWDLLDAIRIARKAAGQNRVIDNLSIEVGGRR
jgi:osmotically-inducible protein OsmY